jgi:hypothetical protein
MLATFVLKVQRFKGSAFRGSWVPGFWNLLNYNGCQKYVPIELADLSKVIASEAKQSLRASKRLLRRLAPRNDSLSEQFFDNRYSFIGFIGWLHLNQFNKYKQSNQLNRSNKCWDADTSEPMNPEPLNPYFVYR